MSLDVAFDNAASSWLMLTGLPGTYRSVHGGDIAVMVTVEKAVDNVDDRGLVSRRDIAVIQSGVVSPSEGDKIEVNGAR